MSISIEQLRYVCLGTRDVEAAAKFARDELGLQSVAAGADEAWFRSDERQYTLVYEKGDPRRQAIGLEVASTADLDAATQALQAHGITATLEETTARRRNVRALLAFDTPGGMRVELVVRPQNQGWRFFPGRDAGVTGLAAVALRTNAVAADEAMWTQVFGVRVADWVGDSAYLAFDGAHHRIALHPSSQAGVLAVEFNVDGINAVMQQFHRLRPEPHLVAHGPGRRPASDQVFIDFAGPDQVLYGFVAEGHRVEPGSEPRPRQFAQHPSSYCSWGSECRIAELQSDASQAPARPQLREVPRT